MKYGKIHVYPLTVDFDLLDAGNVVHHPNYLVLCERARVSAMRDAGYAFSEMWKENSSFALVDTESKYLRPAQLDERLSILTETTSFTGATLNIHQRLVLAKTNYFTTQGYHDSLPVDFIETEYFWIKMRVACIKLSPIRPTRLTPRILTSLELHESDK